MDVSGIGQSFQTNSTSSLFPIFRNPAAGVESSQQSDSISAQNKQLQQEIAVVEELLQLLAKVLSGSQSGGGAAQSAAGGGNGQPQQSGDSVGTSAPNTMQGSAPSQITPSQNTPTQSQLSQAAPTQGASEQSSPNPTGFTARTDSHTIPGAPASAPVGGVNTTNAKGQREDVLIGSYNDPQNLADPGQIAKNPRVGLWLTQLGYDKTIGDSAGRNAVANAWSGKGYSLERAVVPGGYGSTQSGGLNSQFTQYTNGKVNLNTQTADLGDESGMISDASVNNFESDLKSQRAHGQNLLPVYGPNSPNGTPGNFHDPFSSSNFDNFRKVAKDAGGFVLDAPPDNLNDPSYSKWYQDATNWAHKNGLKVEWYAAPGDGNTSTSDYLNGVKKAVDTMNATGTNPDTYIMGNYSPTNPAATVAVEEQAAQYVLNNTTPT